MPNLGPAELGIILVIIIIIFGAGKLPELGGALGRGIREFRQSAQSDDETTTTTESTEVKSTKTPVKEEL